MGKNRKIVRQTGLSSLGRTTSVEEKEIRS